MSRSILRDRPAHRDSECLGSVVRDMRLIVPGVEISQDEGAMRALDFEIVFEQIAEVGR